MCTGSSESARSVGRLGLREEAAQAEVLHFEWAGVAPEVAPNYQAMVAQGVLDWYSPTEVAAAEAEGLESEEVEASEEWQKAWHFSKIEKAVVCARLAFCPPDPAWIWTWACAGTRSCMRHGTLDSR